MKTLNDQLSNYAAYHRDRRNILTHFIGIPMIVLAVVVLLARPAFEVAGLSLTPATLAVIIATLYYLRLDLRYGVAMGLLLAACLAFASATAGLSTGAWATLGVGLFVVGWVIQFVGHIYEGRKPAFVDDVMGLIIGPLFVVAELAFLMGLRREVEAVVESRAGPVHSAAARSPSDPARGARQTPKPSTPSRAAAFQRAPHTEPHRAPHRRCPARRGCSSPLSLVDEQARFAVRGPCGAVAGHRIRRHHRHWFGLGPDLRAHPVYQGRGRGQRARARGA
jgi:uncharacterized membrane protein YGL010W